MQFMGKVASSKSLEVDLHTDGLDAACLLFSLDAVDLQTVGQSDLNEVASPWPPCAAAIQREILTLFQLPHWPGPNLSRPNGGECF